MNNNLFNKVEQKTNVKKNDIINLAKSIQNKNMNDENNLRDLIHTIASMAGKDVDKEKEDKIVNAVKNNQVNDEIKNDVMSVAAGFIDASGNANTGDGRAAIEIASIRNSNVMVGSMKTFDDYFADTVTNVGLKGEQAETQLLSQATIMEDLLNLRDSISGVNIDEELAEIMKFQHGYNAAARFITVWDSMLDTIINRLGV